MKVRTDFVTNSSSSSFLVSLRIELRNGRVLEFQERGSGGEGSSRDFHGLYIRVSPKQLAHAGSVDELIALLKNGVKDVDRKIFDENDPERNQMIREWEESGWRYGLQNYERALSFAHSLPLISKMEDIRVISITGDERGRDGYNRYYRQFTYDCDTEVYTLSSRGMPFDSEGGGGDLYFSDEDEAIMFQFDTPDFLNFKNRVFVLTGFSESKKQELKQLIESKGGEVQESVRTETSYLVVNKDYDHTTTKYNDAMSANQCANNWRNIAIIEESTLQFFAKHPSGWVREGGAPLRTVVKKQKEYRSGGYKISEYNMIADVSSTVKELILTDTSIDGLMGHALDSLDSLDCIVLNKDFKLETSVPCPVKKAVLGTMRLLNNFPAIPNDLEVPLEDLRGCSDSVMKYAAERFWRELRSGKRFDREFEKNYLDYFETQRKAIVANPTDGAFLLYIISNILLTKVDIGILFKQESFFDLPECNQIILQLAKKESIAKVDAQTLLKKLNFSENSEIQQLLQKIALPSKRDAGSFDKFWAKRKAVGPSIKINVAYNYKGNAIEVMVPSELKGAAIDCLGPYALSPIEDGLSEEQIAARKAIKKVVIPEGIRYN